MEAEEGRQPSAAPSPHAVDLIFERDMPSLIAHLVITGCAHELDCRESGLPEEQWCSRHRIEAEARRTVRRVFDLEELLEWCVVDLKRAVDAFDDQEPDLTKRCIARAAKLGIVDAVMDARAKDAQWSSANRMIEQLRESEARAIQHVKDLRAENERLRERLGRMEASQ